MEQISIINFQKTIFRKFNINGHLKKSIGCKFLLIEINGFTEENIYK